MSKNEKKMVLLAAALVAIAVACRVRDMYVPEGWRAGWLRSAIYIGMFAVWGVTVRLRILQKQPKRYLAAAADLIVFWIAVRTAKYFFVPTVEAAFVPRYLWYLYYLPMLFIPTFTLLVAMSMGMAEEERLPKRAALLYIPPTVIFALVMTNDLHQTVFLFPKDAERWTTVDYDYGVGYYLVCAWMLVCTLAMLAVMMKKCRIPGSRRIILTPIVPVLLLILYTVIYYLDVPWIVFIAGDVTSVHCLMYAATLELCIQSGLIRSNTHYRELFDASDIAAVITDGDYNICLSSNKADLLSRDVMRSTESGAVTSGGVRICGATIRGGHFIWQEDISDLLSVLQRLHDTRIKLREYANLLEAENEQKKKRCELEEQKRLYEVVRQTVSPAMERLSGMIALLDEGDGADSDDTKSHDSPSESLLYGRIAIVGAYIKRRSNLIFLSDRTGKVDSRELLLCLNESASYLRLAGIECAVRLDPVGEICGNAAGVMYDFFEEVIESVWDRVTALNVCVSEDEVGYGITLMAEWERGDAPQFPSFVHAAVELDEDVCYFRLNVEKGGVGE